MLYKQSIFLSALFFLLASCSDSIEKNQQLKIIDGFAESYFNYNFQSAANYCTPESDKWLRYEAAQMTEADVKQLVIKPQGISYNIQSIEYPTETSSFVTLEVNDLYTTSNLDSIGHVKSNVIFRLPMIYSEDKWQVDLDKPLRPKQRSDL